MVKPTLFELEGYMLSIGCQNYKEESEKFFDYFDSVGWVVGAKKPMKDWRAACRTWKRGVKDVPVKKTYNEMPTRSNSNAPKVQECAPPPPEFRELMKNLAQRKAAF